MGVKANTFSIDAVRAGVSRIAMIAAVGEVEGAGTLALDESLLDTFGSPVAKITMKWTERDREGFAAQARSLQDVAEAMGATRQSDIPPVPSRKEDHHPYGPPPWRTSPDDGVCDPNLKVFGLDNLHLASSSVFPHMSAYTPTLTIAALALRLAAHLSGEGS